MEEVNLANTSSRDVVTFDILVEENAINPEYQVLSVSITKEFNRIPAACIVFRDGEASDRTFAISNKDDFIPGKKIRIKIGRDSDNVQAFKGIIVRHSIKVKENGVSELLVECRDDAVRMTIGRHSHYYQNMKDSELFDELIGRYKAGGLKGDTKPTTLKHNQLIQHHISDWDFMLLRAEANSMLVNVDDGTIKIAKPDTSPAAVVQVTYGSSIIEFESEIDARYQFKSVNAESWDY